jgi:Novel STAND NTPase 1
MHPIDKKIFTRLIRLLRKNRRTATPSEIVDVVEMIDPILGLPTAGKPGATTSGSARRDGRKSGESVQSKRGRKLLDDEPQLGASDELGADATASERRQAADNQNEGPYAAVADEAADLSGAEQKSTMLRTVSFRQTELAKHESTLPEVPSFNIVANARLWRRDQGNLNYSGEVAKLYRDVFTPTRPKRAYKDFSGRRDMIEAVIQAVEEEKTHVVLLGEKGIGKTSLANIVGECAKEAGYLVARVTCSADLTFEHLMRSILEQFSDRIAEAPVGDLLQKRLGATDLIDLIEGEVFDVPSAIRVFQKLAENQAVVLIDDFERIECNDFKVKIAELMEVLSDQGAWLSLLIFARGARAVDILPDAFETVPNVTWLKLQPMTEEECGHIIRRGAASVGIRFDDPVVDALINLSQGVPSALQWLCLLSIRKATQRYASDVELQDLAEIVGLAANKVDPKLSACYDDLCGSNRGRSIDDTLYLAVQTPTDPNGLFSTDSMSQISFDAIGRSMVELPLHKALSKLSKNGGDQPPILEKVQASGGTCYRFVSPTMRSIVMMKNVGRLANMPDSLLEKVDDIELLPSPGAA